MPFSPDPSTPLLASAPRLGADTRASFRSWARDCGVTDASQITILLEAVAAVAEERDDYRSALEAADKALYDARCGLDRGIAFARDGQAAKLTGQQSGVPEMEGYLTRARKANRAVKEALTDAE